MTDLPEETNNLIRLRVASVICVLLPVFYIDFCNATDEQLELALIENIDQVRGNEFGETRQKGVELFLNTLLDPPFCHEAISRLAGAGRTALI